MEKTLLKTQKQLIETQMELLRYQYREICEKLAAHEKQIDANSGDDKMQN